jgi:hypothetical protein
MEQVMMDVGRVTDQELIAQLRHLVRADRTLSARLLVHLGEVDARGMYRQDAYPSMFAYCVEELGMSEAEAYLRIQAARLGRQFPLILRLFANGSLHLTAIKLLGPHLTAANHAQLLEQASGKNKREIELIVATVAPRPDVPSRMRKLPEPSSARVTSAPARVTPGSHAGQATGAADSASRATQATVHAAGAADSPTAAPASRATQATGAVHASTAAPTSHATQPEFALSAPRPAASSTPLRPGRYKLELTAGQALHDKLEQLKNLLRHQVPDGDLATIVERAVDLLVDETLKQRFAQVRTPRKPRSNKRGVRRRKLNSRYIPRAVVREVHERDGEQCTFVSSDGKRCRERGYLELHHRDPFARGGEATAANLTLLCRCHNSLLAERDFGAGFMRSKLLQAPGPSRELRQNPSLNSFQNEFSRLSLHSQQAASRQAPRDDQN